MAGNGREEEGAWNPSSWLAKPERGGGRGGRYDLLASLLDKSAVAGRILVVYIWFWVLLAVGMAIWHLKDPEGAERGWGIDGYVKGTEARLTFPNPAPTPIPNKEGQPSSDSMGKGEPKGGQSMPPHPWRRGPVTCPDGTTFGN